MNNNTIEKSIYDDEEFNNIITDIINHPEVQKLKNFRQHYSTSIFIHCQNVAYYTYKFCKKHNLEYVDATRAAMLHDFFLYDWREKRDDKKILPHGFTHPRTAYENAIKYFELNDMQKDVILKHMWPLTVIPPRYKESFVITLTDKYSALQEWYEYMRNRKKYNNKGEIL